jgi:hypothetical protein
MRLAYRQSLERNTGALLDELDTDCRQTEHRSPDGRDNEILPLRNRHPNTNFLNGNLQEPVDFFHVVCLAFSNRNTSCPESSATRHIYGILALGMKNATT